MIVIDEKERPQQIPGKENLTKLDGCFVDDFGTIPITLWNEQIAVVKSGEYYEFQNICLRKYSENLYLSSTTSTNIKQISVDKALPKEAVQQAAERFKMREIVCDDVQTADVLKYYSCINCMKKVPFRQDSPMLKCTYCQSRFLVKKSTKTTSVRISLKVDKENKWYTLFSSCLQEIIVKYNKDNICDENLDEIDEDKLCEIILESEDVQYSLEQESTRSGTNLTFDTGSPAKSQQPPKALTDTGNPVTTQQSAAHTTNTAYGSSLYGQPSLATTAYGSSLYGQPSLATTAYGSSLYGQPSLATTAYGSSLYGQPSLATTAYGSSLYGQPSLATTAYNGSSLYGQPILATTAYGSTLYGQPSIVTSAYGSTKAYPSTPVAPGQPTVQAYPSTPVTPGQPTVQAYSSIPVTPGQPTIQAYSSNPVTP
ncbi:hypothetical protein QZH41_004623 [Actinostola sp. cb2023]|nr:hypothetical protein QZH41_004623 [Actinostola sp. cb2023]